MYDAGHREGYYDARRATHGARRTTHQRGTAMARRTTNLLIWEMLQDLVCFKTALTRTTQTTNWVTAQCARRVCLLYMTDSIHPFVPVPKRYLSQNHS